MNEILKLQIKLVVLLLLRMEKLNQKGLGCLLHKKGAEITK